MSTSLRKALAERIDAVSEARVDLDTLVGLGEARLRHQRRRRGAFIGGAVAAVTAIAVILAGGRTLDTTPNPSVGEPSRVASQPYISAPSLVGHLARQAGTPPQLLNCVNPHGWGAAKVQAAAFTNAAPDPKGGSLVELNEFILQYPDATTAEHALAAAVQQVRSCPTPGRRWAQDHFSIDRNPDRRVSYDEAWATERLHWPPGPRHGRIPTSSYTFRIARANNVLVVIETSGGSDDRSGTVLDAAVTQALPGYHRNP